MKAKRIKDVFNGLADNAQMAPLSALKPTQLTVGLREVERKQASLRDMRREKKPAHTEKYLDAHPIKVVLGPDQGLYVIDHHHLALALLREKYDIVPVDIVHDFSRLSKKDFWREMQARRLVHLEDAEGKPRSIDALPPYLSDLSDDPYRSLAWFVRNNGGFDKVATPYAEFEWANYFRKLIPLERLEADFKAVVREATLLAHDKAAAHLPGYTEAPVKKTAKAAKRGLKK